MKKLTKEEFIKRAIAKHGEGRYDYSGVVYKNSSTEVEIKCNVCGKIFFQRPDSHLQGKGCRYCGYKKSHPLTTLDEFFRKARVVHGDKYDYSQVKFEKVKDKITIICPEHGPFSQAVINHYFGQGCPKCGIKKNAQKLRSNTDDFVKKAKIIHGDKYNYDLVKYVNNRTPIQIICNTCETEFSQTPHSHLLGRGCLNCANNQPIGTEEFIRRAKEVWGDRYLYDKVNHKGNKKKVIIICRKHGEFKSNAYDFLHGHGCPECARETSKEARRKEQELFIAQCRAKHGDKYDYSQTIYKGCQQRITIICSIHGPFKQWPQNHLSGEGCKFCKIDLMKKLFSMGKDEFIRKARKVHGDKYDYSKVKYINNKTAVIVICPEHGQFLVAPQDHIQGGNGCPKCQSSKGETKIRVFLENNSIKYQSQKRFKTSMAIGKRKVFIVDFFIPEKKLIIEYNGEQHYRSKALWGGAKQLKQQQLRDEALRQFCQVSEIKLLEIPYTEFDRIEDILHLSQL